MFCKNCGYKLNDGDTFCPNCRTPVGRGNNHCNVCGRYVSQNSRFCPNCGTKIRTSDDVNENYYGDINLDDINQYGQIYKRKSRLIAGLLAVLVGVFGIHNFYIGRNGKAIAQILISVIGGILSCGIATFCVYFWALIEGILIFTGSINCDAKGIPFTD